MAAEVWHGDPAMFVASSSLRAVVLPGRGGRIASLVDPRGVEWLEQPALPLVAPSDLPEEFVDGDMFGWDECAPTIDFCEVGGWTMPDHGDLWDIGWTDCPERGAGWLRGDSPAGTHWLRRRIVALDAGLRLEYEVGTELPEFPYLWSAHPQFDAPPGTRVVFDRPIAELLDGEDPALPAQLWSDHLTLIDSFPAGGAGKLFLPPDIRCSGATLVRADGSALALTWDSAQLPYLGLWFDNGRHSRHPVIAVEPMTGFYDSCAEATRRGRGTVLRAGETLRWWLELRVLLPG